MVREGNPSANNQKAKKQKDEEAFQKQGSRDKERKLNMRNLIFAILLFGCGGVPISSDAGLSSCEDDMDCLNGWHCNASLLICIPNEDAGTPMILDSGMGSDAGEPTNDAGMDASISTDAGHDAGMPDAGTDAGPLFDYAIYREQTSDDIAIAPAPTSWPAADFTLGARVNFDAIHSFFGERAIIVSMFGRDDSRGWIGMELSVLGGLIGCSIGAVQNEREARISYREVLNGAGIQEGDWHDYSCVYEVTSEGTFVRFYIDGMLQASEDISWQTYHPPLSSTPIQIGAGQFVGMIDNVHLSDDASVSSEIVRFEMNEGFGTQTFDAVESLPAAWDAPTAYLWRVVGPLSP